MSRPIKFRVWSKEVKRMYPVELLAHPTETGFDSIGITDSGFETWLEGDEFELMQFTGLKDKNGVEIYEWDIVRIRHPHDKVRLPSGKTVYGDFADTIGQVFWWDEEGGWYHGNDAGRPPKRMWEHCEVIGNIYENKNLLEDK